MKAEKINKLTGEITPAPQLNEVIEVRSIRPNGTLRIARDFSNCPSMAEQHTAHLSNLNYLMKKYKPDELAAYIAARTAHRVEILGHDFSQEPDLQAAKNVIYKSKQEFEKLPDDLRSQFKNHVEFLKFIDNPANEQKMLNLGLLTQKQINSIKIDTDSANAENPATTQEAAKKA